MRLAEQWGETKPTAPGPPGRLGYLALLSVLVLASPATAQEPYVVGGEDDPSVAKEKAPASVVHAKATLVGSLQYSDRFAVGRVVLSPDGQEVVAVTRASHSGLKAWETATGTKLQLPPTPDTVDAMAYSHDMSLLAVSARRDPMARGSQGGLFLYDMGSGELLENVAGGEEATSMAFSPDDSMLLVANADGILSWTPRNHSASPRLFLDLREGADWVGFASDREVYVAANGGGLVLKVSFPGGEVLKSWRGSSSDGVVATCPDGSLVARSEGKELQLHRLQGGGGGIQRIDAGSRITALSWGASGDTLAAGTSSGKVLLYRLDGVGGLPVRSGRSSAKHSQHEAQQHEAGDIEPAEDSEQKRPSQDSTRSKRKSRVRPPRGLPPPRPIGPAKRAQVLPRFEVLILTQLEGDPRTSRSMEETLRSRTKKLDGCWYKALRRKQPVAGQLVLDLSVSPNGEGRSMSAPLKDSIGNTDLHLCLVDRLRGEVFGPGLGGAEIQLTVQLRVVSPP